MSDLQGALIVLGVVAVAAVAGFNVWQERQFRRRSDAALPGAARDPLMGSDARQVVVDDDSNLRDVPDPQPMARREPMFSGRIEPSLGGLGTEPLDAYDTGGAEADEMPQPAAAERDRDRSEPASTAAGALDGPGGLWFPVVIRLPADVDPAALEVIRADIATIRVSEWVGHDPWHADDVSAGSGPFIDHVLRIQAVSPAGAATATELRAALGKAQWAASGLGGEAIALDPQSAAQAAAGLHEFCSSVDVAIGLNVTANSGGFVGTKLRGLIEAAGFRALPDHTYVLSDDAGTTLCTLTDGDGGGLDPQALKAQAVRAISLQLDVPRTPGTLAQFERTATLARQFANGLSGSVVDDSGRVLDEASIARIRAQLASMLKAMRARGIEPGDAVSRRVFG